MTEQNINQENQLAYIDEEKKSKRRYIIIGNVLIFFFCIFSFEFFITVVSPSTTESSGPLNFPTETEAYSFLSLVAILTIQIISLIIATIVNFIKKDSYKAKTYLMSLLCIVLIVATFIL